MQAPVGVKCRRLGGGLAVSYSCDGCALKGAVLETQSNYVHQLGSTNTVSMCVQVIAGSTHAVYYKTLKHALGIEAVSAPSFMDTIYTIVKSMLDKVCEVAKQEMKDKKEDGLESWKKAVTVADGTWQTRGWHSKNATFTVRNYLNGGVTSTIITSARRAEIKLLKKSCIKAHNNLPKGMLHTLHLRGPKRRAWRLLSTGRTQTPPRPRQSVTCFLMPRL